MSFKSFINFSAGGYSVVQLSGTVCAIFVISIWRNRCVIFKEIVAGVYEMSFSHLSIFSFCSCGSDVIVIFSHWVHIVANYRLSKYINR